MAEFEYWFIIKYYYYHQFGATLHLLKYNTTKLQGCFMLSVCVMYSKYCNLLFLNVFTSHVLEFHEILKEKVC